MEIKLTHPAVEMAYSRIVATGLNQIRCCLTGAPYATINESDIMDSLEVEMINNPTLSIDRLVDSWHLKLLTFNSGKLPILRNAKESALLPLMSRGHAGQVMALTYLVTRLVCKMPVGFNIDEHLARMDFSTKMYDSAIKWEPAKVNDMVQHLVAVDSYCAMPYWRKLYPFESRLSGVSIWVAKASVRNLFLAPMEQELTPELIANLISFMFILMVHVAERDGTAGYSGNRMSQQILVLTASEQADRPIPLHQKELSQADIDRQAKMRSVNATNAVRIAYSATHGKGVVAGQHPKRTAKSDSSKPKSDKARQSDFNKKFLAAFETLKGNDVDDSFTAALNSLMKKG